MQNKISIQKLTDSLTSKFGRTQLENIAIDLLDKDSAKVGGVSDYDYASSLSRIVAQKNIIDVLVKQAQSICSFPDSNFFYKKEITTNVQSYDSDHVLQSCVVKITQLENDKKTFEDKINQDYNESIDRSKNQIEQGLYFTAKENLLFIESKLNQDKSIKNPYLSFRIYTNLGVCYLKLNEITKSIDYFKRASTYHPEDLKSITHLALSQMLDKDYSMATKTIDKALSIDPNCVYSINVKSNILAKQKKYNELFAFLKEKDSEENLVLFSALKHREEEDYQKAKSQFEKLVKKWGENLEYLLLAAENLVATNSRLLENAFFFSFNMPDEVLKNAKDAEKIFSVVLEKISKHELSKTQTIVYTNRATCRTILTMYTEAIEDCNQAIYIDKNNALAYLSKAICLMKKQNYTDAIEAFQKYDDLACMDIKYVSEFLYCLIQAKQIRKSKILISEWLTDEIDYKHFKIVELALEVYYSNFEYELAEQLIQKLEKQYFNDSNFLIVKAKYYSLIKKKGVIELLEKALEKSTCHNHDFAKITLANQLFKEKEYKKASLFYKDFLNGRTVNICVRKYLICLYEMRKFGECLNVISYYQNKDPNKDRYFQQIADIEAEVHFALDNLASASALCLQVYQKTSHIRFLILYGICLFRQNKKEKALAVFERVESNELGLDDTLMLSEWYCDIGLIKKTVKICYKALKKNYDSAQLHFSYITSFLEAQKNEISFPNDYLQQFNESLINYNKRFPEENSLIKIENDKNGTILSNLISESSYYSRRLLSLYKRKSISLNGYSLLSRKNVFKVWKDVCLSENIGVWMSLGSIEEIKEEELVLDNSKNIVVDWVVFFTLAHMNQINILTILFENIYVAQDTFDQFTKILTSLAEVKNLKTSTSLNNSKKFIERVIDFIVDECFISGISREFSDYEKQHVYSLGTTSLCSLILAEDKGLSLLSDEVLVRESAKQKNIKSFSTQSLYNFALKKFHLEKECFYELLLGFSKINYYHIHSIDINCIKYFVAKEGYTLQNKYLEQLLLEITNPKTPTKTIIYFLSYLLKDLWLSNTLNVQQDAILIRILSLLHKNHSFINVISRLLEKLKLDMTLIPHCYLEIENKVFNFSQSKILF
ncbi:hypothetical protein [Candidatus Uabimicrobium sp. HlEnr_7]|uniref:tetratricopeptide repeat protein n=1 Tax=Candidatus Uabimicrobium helgolandensis TaxID=3095367 RepID=UPI0035591519